MVRSIYAAACVLMTMSSSGYAQNLTILNNSSNIPSAGGNTGEKSQMTASVSDADLTRRLAAVDQSLYQVVNRECEILGASMNGNCRLTHLNVSGDIGTNPPNSDE
jgi:hypothetical protein